MFVTQWSQRRSPRRRQSASVKRWASAASGDVGRCSPPASDPARSLWRGQRSRHRPAGQILLCDWTVIS